MARKKLDLSISNPDSNQSKYRDFTRNYRQSANVEDRRGSVSYAGSHSRLGFNYEPSEGQTPRGKSQTTPSSGDKYTTSTYDTTPDDYATSDIGSKISPTTTRKVSPEEAVDRTHNRRY